MISRDKKLALASIAGATAILFAVVWAASARPARENVRPAATKSTAKISAFKRRFRPTRAQRVDRRAISRQTRRSPRASIAFTADVGRSRPAPVEGYGDSVWIVPAEDGSVCTFIPDPIDGWGAACATAEEVAGGQAMTMLGGAPGSTLGDNAIVVVVVPDGVEGPTVRRPDGNVSAMDVSSNVAAAVLPPGALVRSGRASIAVPDPQPPELSP